jgi:hypothetical protein
VVIAEVANEPGTRLGPLMLGPADTGPLPYLWIPLGSRALVQIGGGGDFGRDRCVDPDTDQAANAACQIS